MAWYDEAVFYHIYPLGLLGAPEKNDYGEAVHRLPALYPWISHLKEMGIGGLYIGPLFESVGHGYETTDYRKVDSRLGTNEDLKELVRRCHEAGIRVILDGVFNHTGRDFFAFRDLKENRENSRYLSWYCNVNFWGNNEYNDGFSYDNWGGYNLLARLNLKNPEVREYLLDTIRFWVREFDIDGLRLDTADVLDFDFMRSLRTLAGEVKEEFWLMGEVIHGEYSRWVNDRTLHSVTNYHLHKALYSAHNDRNYFEIAHTVKRQMDMGSGISDSLYNFADNHDVERIFTKLRRKEHFLPVHVLLFTLPGIPSIYYGSEFGIEGRKERYSDASLRPALDLAALTSAQSPCFRLIKTLGKAHGTLPDLWYGDYRELQLTTTQYAFSRGRVLVTVNNEDRPAVFDLPGDGTYRGVLGGKQTEAQNGRLHLEIEGNGGEIWVPAGDGSSSGKHRETPAGAKIKSAMFTEKSREKSKKIPDKKSAEKGPADNNAWKHKALEEMTVEELQAAVLEKLAANGPVTDRMKQDVFENVYPDSLRNWVRSFR